MKLAAAMAGCGLMVAGCRSSGDSVDLNAFMNEALRVPSFRSAQTDLNADGRPETVVYATNPGRCGSGGCTLFVLRQTNGRFEVVSRTTISRPPIRVLETETNGWRDLAVTVSGGGIREPYVARVPFDGTGYALNPTVPPATPIQDVAGEILIGG